MTRRRRLLWLTAALLGFTVLLCGWTVESMMLDGGPAALPQAERPLAGNNGGPATAPTGRPGRPARPFVPSRPTGGVTPVVLEPPPAAPPSSPAVPIGGGVQVLVTGCPSEEVLVSYVSRFTATPSPGYKVVGVHLSALQPVCPGRTVTVRLAAAAGSAGEVQASVPYAPGALDVSFAEGDQVLSQDVRAVEVTLS